MPSFRDLPLEIWHHILLFIPSKTLRDLYSVCREFLHFALDERYKNVQMYWPSDKTTIEFFNHLK